MKQRAVGGWIKDAGSVGMGEYLQLEDFSAQKASVIPGATST